MKVTIYGTDACSFCKKAVCICSLHGVDYTYKIVGEDITKEQLEEAVGHTVRAVPQIFAHSDEKGTEYVGGYDELYALLSS